MYYSKWSLTFTSTAIPSSALLDATLDAGFCVLKLNAYSLALSHTLFLLNLLLELHKSGSMYSISGAVDVPNLR